MIDTHSHIYSAEFDDDRDLVVQRAVEAGVTHIILPNENLDSVPRLLDTAARYPGRISLALGLHPEDVHDDWDDVLDQMETLFDQHPWVAIGEVGIDLYWDKTFRREQMQALERQLGWCVDRDLPFILHCREALDEVLDVLRQFAGQMPRGVFHCFTGMTHDIDRIRQVGDFCFGIGGVLTFKKSRLPEVLSVIGLDRILLETDAPYMAPVPHRGKRNESAYVADIARCMAQALNLPLDEVDRVTTATANTLFGLQVR
ncbi:MAG: TatD family hydrolase [Muribaculaceae bacterium]|nr:TatD family hydrolase [Muribaculaceae bacterium]